MRQFFTLFLLIVTITIANAATFRNYVAHTISGTTYSVYVNSDTVFEETTLGEVRYTDSNGVTQFTGIQDGVFDTSVNGANWRININIPADATNIILQLATRNQSGSNYGFTGFNITMNNLLPVELINFKVRTKNTSSIITWQTATEQNNSHFDIQHSTTSKTWNTIGKVTGAGTTNEVQNYTYIDKTPVQGINYYRLKQVDYDGAFDYSPIVSVEMGKDEGMTISPNPVANDMVINFANTQRKGTQVAIYTINGQLVQQMTLEADSLQLPLVMSDLEQGIYFVQVMTDQTQLVQRFVKQ